MTNRTKTDDLPAETEPELPSDLQAMGQFDEMGIPAVRLLQGVLYQDDEATWNILLSNESDLTSYFAKIALELIIDRGEGLAYLRQLSEGERTGGYERLPRLFRRTSLGYDATLLCVLLRDAYQRFEDEDLENERCVVAIDELLEAWTSFFPAESDEVRLRKKLHSTLHKMESLKFVQKLQADPESWEVRKILKARLPLEELEGLRDRLLEVERLG